MNNFDDLTYYRSGREIENITEWLWIKGDGGIGSDGGAWVGPREDWITSHSKKFFTHVKKFDTVIQAGGNLGMYPKFLASRFKQVYTFEPDPLNFHCLVNNCQNDNIIKFNAGLGEVNGFGNVIRHTSTNVGMNQIVENLKGIVPIISIDSMNFTDLDMIILDTEGYEPFIVKGALKTIEKFKPVITSESSNIFELIKQFGYIPVDQSISDTIFVVP